MKKWRELLVQREWSELTGPWRMQLTFPIHSPHPCRTTLTQPQRSTRPPTNATTRQLAMRHGMSQLQPLHDSTPPCCTRCSRRREPWRWTQERMQLLWPMMAGVGCMGQPLDEERLMNKIQREQRNFSVAGTIQLLHAHFESTEGFSSHGAFAWFLCTPPSGIDEGHPWLVLSIRGSYKTTPMLTFTNTLMAPFDAKLDQCLVHRGFLHAYQGLREALFMTYASLHRAHPDATFVIGANSLGAALATLFTFELGISTPCFLIASPRVGNACFYQNFHATFYANHLLCVIDPFDVVVHLPARSEYGGIGDEHLQIFQNWIDTIVQNGSWIPLWGDHSPEKVLRIIQCGCALPLEEESRQSHDMHALTPVSVSDAQPLPPGAA